jgi:hypothetical protein
MGMFTTAVLVPETTVNKNDLPAAHKNQVRFAWEVFSVQAVTKAKTMD